MLDNLNTGASEMALVVNNLPTSSGNVKDAGLTPGLRRSHGEQNGNPLQYSCLENPMDRGDWWAIVYRVAKSDMTEVTYHTCIQFEYYYM